MTSISRPTSLIVGGKSEFLYLTDLWSKGHPWADLSMAPIQLIPAEGDSKIPALVEQRLAAGDAVCVLYDKDALERSHEQAAVISSDRVTVHHLDTDFEGIFDPEIVQRALLRLGYEACVSSLSAAKSSSRPFDQIKNCAVAQNESPRHLRIPPMSAGDSGGSRP